MIFHAVEILIMTDTDDSFGFQTDRETDILGGFYYEKR